MLKLAKNFVVDNNGFINKNLIKYVKSNKSDENIMENSIGFYYSPSQFDQFPTITY